MFLQEGHLNLGIYINQARKLLASAM